MLLHGAMSTKCSMKYQREVTVTPPQVPSIILTTTRRLVAAAIATTTATVFALSAGAIENIPQTFTSVCTTEQKDFTKAEKCTKNGVEFSYEVGSPNGPENWGNLNATWKLCGNGERQSPINLLSYKAVSLPSDQSLVTNYRPAQGTIINRGQDIEVAWKGGDAGWIVINGSQYNVMQCHWHIPSEHTINGQRVEMELHIVHANSQGSLAVTAVLYKFGAPDPFLAQFTPLLESIGEAYQEAEAGTIDPTSIMFDTTSNYFRYNGSLTTPPCSENVTWTVINNVKTVSKDQVRALQKAVHAPVGNARPVQPLNRRTVYLYRHQSHISY